MRVVIVPHDIAPVAVKHPAPLKAAPVAQAGVSLVSLDTKKGPPRSNATLRAIAEAKSEAARAATRKAEQARREAVAERVEVARDSKTLRMLEVAKTRAEERASAIERALQAPNLAAETKQQFEQEQGIAAEAVRQAQDKLETASAEGQQKKDGAEAAREAASTAEAERAAAEAEAQEAQRKLRPSRLLKTTATGSKSVQAVDLAGSSRFAIARRRPQDPVLRGRTVLQRFHHLAQAALVGFGSIFARQRFQHRHPDRGQLAVEVHVQIDPQPLGRGSGLDAVDVGNRSNGGHQRNLLARFGRRLFGLRPIRREGV